MVFCQQNHRSVIVKQPLCCNTCAQVQLYLSVGTLVSTCRYYCFVPIKQMQNYGKKLQNHGKNEMKDCGVQRISYICGAKDRVIEKKCVSLQHS